MQSLLKKYPSEYRAWLNMRQRCRNPNHEFFHRYGGRGITWCPEWESFETFIREMGAKPSKGYSLERVDNEKGYSKNNCKWATRQEQMDNYSGCHPIGDYPSIEKASQATGLRPGTLRDRIKNGWTLEDALTRPTRAYSKKEN